jgi:hypothetical protein
MVGPMGEACARAANGHAAAPLVFDALALLSHGPPPKPGQIKDRFFHCVCPVADKNQDAPLGHPVEAVQHEGDEIEFSRDISRLFGTFE